MNYFVNSDENSIIQLDAFVQIQKSDSKVNGKYSILGYTGIYQDSYICLFSHTDKDYVSWVYQRMVQALLLDRDFTLQREDYDEFCKIKKDSDIKKTLADMIEKNNAICNQTTEI